MDLTRGIDLDEPMDGTVPQPAQPAPAPHPSMEQIMSMMREMMEEQRREHQRQMAELRQQFQQQFKQQSTATPPPTNAPPAAHRATVNRIEPDYMQKQQLKALAITVFEGKLDHKLTVEFVRKMRLVGQVLRLRPAFSGADSNALIELAVGYFSDEPMNWFQKVVLDGEFSTTYDDARVNGFPLTFDAFAERLIHRYSATSATEDLWTELQKMQRKNYPNVYAFHHAFLATTKMLGVYRETEQKGGRAFAIYLQKLTAREETIYQSMLASLHRDRETMYLDDLMTIVENVESNRANIPRDADPAPTTSASATAAPSATTTITTGTGPTPTGPTPMELDAVNVRSRGRERVQCYTCNGYGHLSYQCPTTDEYKAQAGRSLPRRGRGGYGSHGAGRGDSRRGGYGGSRGTRGGRGGSTSQVTVHQLEEGNAEEKSGQIIGEVRDGKVYALEKEEDPDF
jgi:uncharacterized membrane protein YgcG